MRSESHYFKRPMRRLACTCTAAERQSCSCSCTPRCAAPSTSVHMFGAGSRLQSAYSRLPPSRLAPLTVRAAPAVSCISCVLTSSRATAPSQPNCIGKGAHTLSIPVPTFSSVFLASWIDGLQRAPHAFYEIAVSSPSPFSSTQHAQVVGIMFKTYASRLLCSTEQAPPEDSRLGFASDCRFGVQQKVTSVNGAMTPEGTSHSLFAACPNAAVPASAAKQAKRARHIHGVARVAACAFRRPAETAESILPVATGLVEA